MEDGNRERERKREREITCKSSAAGCLEITKEKGKAQLVSSDHSQLFQLHGNQLIYNVNCTHFYFLSW